MKYIVCLNRKRELFNMWFSTSNMITCRVRYAMVVCAVKLYVQKIETFFFVQKAIDKRKVVPDLNKTL
jgi:hypothetical protein